MWYIIIPSIMIATGILLLSFGIWAMVRWDDYGKLSSDIKEIIEKIHL